MADNVAGYAWALRHNAVHLHARRAAAPPPPITGSTFDFVTVVFGVELDLLALQARSLDRWLDLSFDGRIFVVVNDLCCTSVMQRIEAGVRRHYGRWRHRVTVLPFHKIGYRLDPSNGWIVQQALKLASAQLTTQPHYVVLDAKNHLIAPTPLDVFVAGGLAHQLFTSDPIHLPSHDVACARYFGLDPVDRARPRFVPMTPFVMHTASARALVAHVEARERRGLSAVFCKHRLLSEFLLYGAYLDASGGAAALYRDVDNRTITIWPEDDAVARIADVADNGAICFGVHRRYLARADAASMAALEDLWRRSRLLGHDEQLSGLASRAGDAGRAAAVRQELGASAALTCAAIAFCMLVIGGLVRFTLAGAALMSRTLLRIEPATPRAKVVLQGAMLCCAMAMVGMLNDILGPHGDMGPPGIRLCLEALGLPPPPPPDADEFLSLLL